jgi:hypothetical protein
MRRCSVSGVAWWLSDGYAQVLPVSVTNDLGHHHQHARGQAFAGVRCLPHTQGNFVSLPPAPVSRLCDERPKVVYMGCEYVVAYLPLINAPDERDGLIEQLNVGIRYIQQP